jgi:hypothetical protein
MADVKTKRRPAAPTIERCSLCGLGLTSRYAAKVHAATVDHERLAEVRAKLKEAGNATV